MRLFALFCFAIAIFYGWTAVDTMRTGTATSLRGDSSIVHRRDDPASSYGKYLLARWLACAGFIALGVTMNWFAGKMDQLENEK